MRYIFLLTLFFVSLSASAQIYRPPQTYGIRENRVKVDSTLHIPLDTSNKTRSNILDPGAIVYNLSDSAIYAWDGKRWIKQARSGDIGNPVDSVFRSNDTLQFLKTSGQVIAVKMTGIPQGNIIGLTDSISNRFTKIESDTRYLKKDSVTIFNIRNFGAVSGDGISDSKPIQSAIGKANGKGIVYIPSGTWHIDTTLVVSTGTHIIASTGAIIRLMPGSNCALLSNANKTTSGSLTIVDSSITITGGYWDGNGDNQTKLMTDGTPVVGFLFSGVKNLLFSPTTIYNTQTYALFCSNAYNVRCVNINIDQGATQPSVLHNQDGLHFNGPGRFLSIDNVTIRSWDDAIALNTEDVAQGPWLTQGDITDVTIGDVKFNDTRKGIRLLSATSRMDRISISNVSGTTRDNVLEASSYGLGVGNFGTLTINNVNVDCLSPVLATEYISLNNKAERIIIKDVYRTVSGNTRQTIFVKSSADIGDLTLQNISVIANSTNTFSDILTQTGAKIKKFNIINHSYKSGSRSINNAIELNGLTGDILSITGSRYDSVHKALSIATTTFKSVSLSDNIVLSSDTAVQINNNTSIDTLLLSNNVMKDVSGISFVCNSSTIYKIKTYIPTEAAPTAPAVFVPLQYKYSNATYSINPVSTIDLQTVSNVSGLTTNMLKVTGASNVKSGLGVEMFYSSGIGTVWSFDRGGTNSLQPILLAGTPLMLNTRILAGTNTAAGDDGSTTLQIKGSVAAAQRTISANRTLDGTDYIVKTATSGITITLPPAGLSAGRIYEVVNESAGSIIISPVLIFGVGTTSLPASTCWRIYSDGTSWRLLSRSN